MRISGVVGLAALAGLMAGCESTRGPWADPIVATPTTCAPQRFEIYFADSEARLTPAARQAIGMTAARLQGCDIRTVRVLGLADARGGAVANLNLSEQRAQTVADALTAAGWPAPAFEVEAVGDQGAADASGVREPLRRRTEVLVDAQPR